VSVVTEVVLIAYPTSPDDIQKIISHPFKSEKPSQADREPQFLNRLDSGRAGGTKYAAHDVFQSAFNYVGTDVIVEWFETAPYLRDLCLVLMISDEAHDEPYVLLRNVEDLTT